MKPDIHPTYYPAARVTCSCGATWLTGSTQEEIRTDICSTCHPFYTGEQRIVDTAGQVERFNKKFERAQASGQAVSKRQQRMSAKSAQMAEEQRRADEAQAAARSAQRERARAAAEARAAEEAAAGAEEVAAEVTEEVATEA